MKTTLAFILTLVSPLAFAARSFPALNLRALLWDLFILCGVGVILGIAYVLIDQAPFINAMFKIVLKYLVILVGGILLIYLILGWIGM